ncbi:BRD4-interacting chromatin-remodeling complex-associated protein isoform X1 [Ictalurus punctatus]|uniref:BRD4-interacting chromatin-remodeling complex-associated protein isoform X1 n=1 Tax=Ictalurus punctatus TaxID=7998 RepID=A0A2D0QS86_ICTPU|nr:BRD4-interacting chromatin-remodeling complex-associated protein isoform X1 [Ictalurus punctatus]
MDDEDGRCLLDVICDPQALNDFLHGSETQLDTDDLLDGSSDPSSSFFSSTGEHVPEIQPPSQLSTSEPSGLPRVSVDLDFLEDDDILGASPEEGDNEGNGVGSNHEPCDILQQSLAEANITEQSLQEAEGELDLSSFGLTSLTQVVQPLPDAGMPGVGIAGTTQIFPGQGTPTTPSSAATDMLGSVLAHQGMQLQPQVMNKAINVQPFMQQVGLGNVTLQPISSLQTLPNGSQSGHLGIGQIQVVGQSTVMTINPSGQHILTKTMGGYPLHQPGLDTTSAGAQAGLGGSVLSSGGGLLIQGGKATLGSPSLNGPAICVSSTNTNSSGTTMAAPSGILGFARGPLNTGTQSQTQNQVMQNVIIQRTPTPIQPKPPQGSSIQPKSFKQQPQMPASHTLQNDANKALGVQQVPASTAQNVAFLTGKPSSNVVLSTQTTTQGTQFSQALFKQHSNPTSGKPLSVHLLNQQGSIVIPSQAVLQGQNHQFLLPQLQTGGQILAQQTGGHIITSSGPGGQIIAANQILATNQNINLGQVLAPQGHPGAAHILSGPIQLQPGQMGHPTLFQMPVSLAQSQNKAHSVTGHVQTVIQGMPIQSSLSIEGLSPAVSLQPTLQQQAGGVTGNSSTGVAAIPQCQPSESITELGTSTEQASQSHPQPSILTVQTGPSVSATMLIPSSTSPSSTLTTSTTSVSTVGLASQVQHSPGKVLFTPPSSSIILSQEPVQMFLQQDQQHQAGKEPPASVGVPASVIVTGGSSGSAPTAHDGPLTETRPGENVSPTLGPADMAALVNKVSSSAHQQQALKIQSASPSQSVATHSVTPTLSDSPQPSQASPLIQIQSPHPPQSQPPSQPQAQPSSQSQAPSRACTPSSIPPLFIIHNSIGGSPQPSQAVAQAPQQQTQPQPIQVQIPQVLPQPVVLQHEQLPTSSGSPKPPQAPSSQFHFVTPTVCATAGAVLKQQIPGLTAEQQHHLQLINAQLQTMSSITQPSLQQKQLLEKLNQVQQNILLQAKQQLQPQGSQFSKLPDQPTTPMVNTSASSTVSASVTSLLQQKSVFIKSSVSSSNDTQVFPGTSGPSGITVNQGKPPLNLSQSVQAKPGVISAVGGLTLGKAGLQIQVLNSGLSQMTTLQPSATVQTQTSALKRPLSVEPSKEARILEQLRKLQASVLHPDYSSPFHSFEDTLCRLLPYHVYQGMAPSSQDYRKVDDEFENVSNQLLKRTQAMLDKYRHLLFEESRRLGPSAEMVMIDRMFIQEEKIALNQDRILAKEKPEEFVASSCMVSRVADSGVRPAAVELSSIKTGPATVELSSVKSAVATAHVAGIPAPASTLVTVAATANSVPVSFPPTKLVIKQGGGGALVSWSTSCTSMPASVVRPCAKATGLSSERCFGPTSSSIHSADDDDDDDDDALPQRTSKPPIKTYEARQRIGLKLKIKQEAGFSKVVHNTALDPVHLQPQHTPLPQVPEPPSKTRPPVTQLSIVQRTSPSSSNSTCSITFSAATTHAGSGTTTSSTAPPPSVSHGLSSSLSSCTSSAQVNGTLEHYEVSGAKLNPTSTSAPQLTTCRLPLRKTYRKNISPHHRPGVPGGGNMGPIPPAAPASSPPVERTVIASVKLEQQGVCKPPHTLTDPGSQGLASVEHEFYHGIKNAYQQQQQSSDKEDEEDGNTGDHMGRVMGQMSKNREWAVGTFRMDQHAPGPPSLGETSWARDSSLPAKRSKSDSPDMDNASFSSGSPPLDNSLNEHLQCAIDSILNLQQGPPTRGAVDRVYAGNLTNQHQTHHRQGTASSSTSLYRHSVSSASSPSSSSISQHPQLGGRGQNGNLVSQTHSR